MASCSQIDELSDKWPEFSKFHGSKGERVWDVIPFYSAASDTLNSGVLVGYFGFYPSIW